MPDPNAAGWPECVTTVKAIEGQNATDVASVNWSTISQDDLNNGFKSDKPFPLICPGRHCIENVNQSPAGHSFCNCLDVNGNRLPPNLCTPKIGLDPYATTVCINVANEDPNGNNWPKAGRNCTNLGQNYYEMHCWCCCSCYANGTLILGTTGLKKIEDFQRGDKVMAASISGAPGTATLAWDAARVDFSFGTGDGTQQGMVYIHYGDDGAMICTPDQLFLLENGKLKRGDRLVPGADQLVDPNGEPVDLHTIALGTYHGGVHHIATAPAFSGDLQGHLLNSAGIVTGDFDLQIHADYIKQFFVENHDDLPVVGSAAYEAAYPTLTKTDFSTYGAGSGGEAPASLQFFSHKQKQHHVPPDAASYLTELQATDVANAKLGATFDRVQIHSRTAQNLLKTWGGHFPAVKFVLLWGHMEVNAFAYSLYGQNYVALTDGLVRLEGLDYQGLALIVAHLTTRLSKGAPTGENGWMSVGMSDYFAGGSIQSVYMGPSLSAVMDEGPKQIQSVLFDHISTANTDYTGDPFKPTTQTRSDAIAAGLAFGYPPPGIGGPEQGGLKVIGATVSAPQFNAGSFVARGISAADSQTVYDALVKNGILDSTGTLAQSVTTETDLSFLFPDADDTTKPALIDRVRAILDDADHDVALKFNMSMTNRPIHPDDFEFTPTATVTEASRNPDATDVLHVMAKLEAGTYTVKVKHDVQSTNGSTLDPDHDSADITVD
jgi:hypothetical protein